MSVITLDAHRNKAWSLTGGPPIVALFVPDGVALEATATSRTALG